MNELKKQLNEIALSEATYKKITEIGDKHNLMIDLQGELAAEIRDVIMGFKPAKNFVENIKNRLEIDNDKANEIAIDVNLEILEPIRDKLQQIQEREEDTETAGQVINKPSSIPTTSPSSTISSLEKAGGFEIEKPEPANTSPLYKETGLNKEDILKGIESDSIPMIDHLLTTPTQSAEKIVEKKPESYKADPYRESI